MKQTSMYTKQNFKLNLIYKNDSIFSLEAWWLEQEIQTSKSKHKTNSINSSRMYDDTMCVSNC